MSSSKFGKHLIDSFLGQPNRVPPKYSNKMATPDYLLRYPHSFKQEMKIAEPKFGRGKRIKVWINGEAHCYEFNINPKDFRSWTSILLHITNSMKPIFGAVRKLVALSSLKTIDCFEDLDPKERYIALGSTCKFKMAPGGYRTSSEKELYKREKVTKRFYSGEMNSKVLPFLMETEKKKLTIIYMTVNGRSCQTPQKLVLNSSDMKDWGLIFSFLTKILDVPDGIAYLCTIFGDVLHDPSELQHGYLYVAVPFKEHFVEMDYLNLFEEHQSKYRSSYTLTIRPAPPPPDKLLSAIRKIKKRMSNAEIFGDSRLPDRPCTPLQNRRSSRLSIKDANRQVATIHPKESPSRCDSQPSEQLMLHQVNPAKGDFQPEAQIANIIEDKIDGTMKEYEERVANFEKKFSEESERIIACMKHSEFPEYQSESTSTSNQTSFAALAAYSNQKVSGSQSESTDDPPTYTVMQIPTCRPIDTSHIVSGCNVMTVIKDKIVAVRSREYFRRNQNENVCITEECSKVLDVEMNGGCNNKANHLEIPSVQQSTVVIRNLTDNPNSKNGLLMPAQEAPTIHIRNRTDISIYNIKSSNKYKSTESSCDFDKSDSDRDFLPSGRKINQKKFKYEADRLDDDDDIVKSDRSEYRGWKHKGIKTASYHDMSEGFACPHVCARQKAKSKTFTLNCNYPDLSGDHRSKEHDVENSDTDAYRTVSDEDTSHSSNETKILISGKGDTPPEENGRWNLQYDRESESTVSDQCEVNYKIKKNILEINDVRKSLQKRIGFGSFRVSTPEVENCLKYSLGDGKYMQEDVSYCSISSDSIEMTK